LADRYPSAVTTTGAAGRVYNAVDTTSASFSIIDIDADSQRIDVLDVRVSTTPKPTVLVVLTTTTAVVAKQ
jgi:hypothetical protein